MDQKEALLLWTAINNLSIQISVIKESYARMMDGNLNVKKDKNANSSANFLVRPPGMKQQ